MRRFLTLFVCIFLISWTAGAQYQGKLGINLGNIHSDGYTDMVKGGAPFDKGSTESLLSADELDADGWPLRDFRFLLMDNRPVAEWAGQIDDPEKHRLDFSGTYACSFTGQADIANVGGPWSISNKTYMEATNTTTFDLVIGPPGDNHGLVIMNFSNTRRTPDDPVNSGITNLRIIRPGYGDPGNQYFADHLINGLKDMQFSAVRSQNFTGTTSWNILYPEEYHWNQRKLPDDPIQSSGYAGKRESAAWEHFIDLCNEINSDIWINVPISASNDYVTGLATLLRDRLNEQLNIYVENDNEIWNSAPAFLGTYQYNLDEAADLGISEQVNIARRAVELSNLFASVFGQDQINKRIRVVLASHAPMVKWWVTPMLNYVNDAFGPPKDFIYAISRQTYFSVDGAGGGLSPDQLISACYENIDSQTGPDETNESNRQDWVRVAEDWELPGGANSYEGGPHTPAGGSTENLQNQIRMHRSERMIRLLRYNIVNKWFDIGGGLAMHFTYYSGYNRYGCWGLTDDMQDPDRNHKMEALRNLETVTGLEENDTYDIVIYPNPGNGFFQIRSDPEKMLRIEILDLYGRLIYKDDRYVSGTLIPAEQEDGLYLVRIITEKGTVTKKVIIE